MPSLLRAGETSKRAARVGFEWESLEDVFAKFEEERGELLEAVASGDQAQIEHEVGDLAFTLVNIARWLKVEPEEALRKMVDRFTTRFQQMERAADKPLRDLSPAEWDSLWNEAKV
jgi:tetrapyrrole methylase family protein/MazG family protein